MNSRMLSISIFVFLLTGLLYYQSNQSVHAQSFNSVKAVKAQVIKEKNYANYEVISGWTLGTGFSEIQNEIKHLDYKMPEEDQQYNSRIAFFDDTQFLEFNGGVLQYVATSKKAKGIKDVAVVGDSLNKVLEKLGKPLETLKSDGAVYYGYGTDYTQPQLEIKIKNYKVIEISLEKPSDGFPDENRVVLAYLNSIGDPAADYYVCNTCSTETEATPTMIDSDLTRDDLENMFQTITADMKAYTALSSGKQSDYSNVFTDEQSLMEQSLDEADKNSNGQPDDRLVKKLNLYATLVYDAYSQKALSLAPNISKYDKANYESQAFTSITDAMTIHNEIATYLKLTQ